MHDQAAELGRVPAAKLKVETQIDPDGFDVDHHLWDRAGWLDELRDIPADGWWPRLMTLPHPDAVGSWGADFAEWVRVEHGLVLHWWQRLFATRLLEFDEARALVWYTAWLSVARQSGKSTVLAMLCDWRSEQAWRFGEAQLVMHTADTVQHAHDVQAICVERARRLGHTVRLAAGSVGITKPSVEGSWLLRSQRTVTGAAVSLAVADEAHGIKVGTVKQNLVPTMLEKRQAQIVLVSTAHTDCSELMPMYRVDALAELAEPAGMLMLEWSASPGVALDDPVGWRQSSPHWSAGREKLIASEARQAMGLPVGHEVRFGFDCQYRNRWPASDSRGPGERLLPEGAWVRRRGTVMPVGPGWCAVADNRGQGAAVAFAAVDGDGVVELDGLCCDSWSEALVWARKFVDASPGSRLAIAETMFDAVDRDFPSWSSIKSARSTHTRRGLSLLRSLVAEEHVVHEYTPELDGQVGDARVRLVDGGLTLLPGPRSDLVRAALWALWFAQKPPPAVAIH
jgi:hypothetical protein